MLNDVKINFLFYWKFIFYWINLYRGRYDTPGGRENSARQQKYQQMQS